MTSGFKVEELREKICPKCKVGYLRRAVINAQPATYYCVAKKYGDKNCGLKFDVENIEPKADGGWIVKGKAVNPKYVDMLSSSSFAENLSISVQLEKEGVPFFLEPEYVLETITGADVKQLKNDLPK